MSLVGTENKFIRKSSWRCTCDLCEASCSKSSYDAGEASEFARKEGFVTVAVGTPSQGLPLKWLCRKCAVKTTKQ